MSIKEIQDKINYHLSLSKQHVSDAQALANEYGLSFYYNPPGQGYYAGTLTLKQALAYVESSEFNDLDYDDQDRVKHVIEEGKDSEHDEYDESWRSSFC